MSSKCCFAGAVDILRVSLNLYPGEFTTNSKIQYTYNSLLLFPLPCLQGSCNILPKSQSVQVYKYALLKLVRSHDCTFLLDISFFYQNIAKSILQ